MTYHLNKTLDTTGWYKPLEEQGQSPIIESVKESITDLVDAGMIEGSDNVFEDEEEDIFDAVEKHRKTVKEFDRERDTAQWYLREASRVIGERATLRDLPDGERSMFRAVKAYQALKGVAFHTQLDGWLFMCCLKLARATAGKSHIDDWTDLAGYAALAAECLGKDQEI